MYCLGVCSKILGSGSQSEPIYGYVLATAFQSISTFTEMWQHRLILPLGLSASTVTQSRCWPLV